MMPNKSLRLQLRPGFFSQPKRATPVVAAVSTLAFLVPACLKLTPLGESLHKATDDKNSAQANYENALNAFAQTESQLIEAQQRVIDLSCAMTQYPAYNTALIRFQEQIINSTLSIPDVLQTFWGLSMIPNQLLTSQDTETLSYQVLIPKTCYTEECSGGSGGGGGEGGDSRDASGEECEEIAYACPYWITEYYTQITTYHDTENNILQGPGTNLSSLNCGYYSRNFQIGAPQLYIISESPPVTAGSPDSGTVYVDINRILGAQVPGLQVLDGATFNPDLMVPNTGPQNNSMNSIAAQLFQFLGASVALFNTTGSNYPALQKMINGTIPTLMANATALNSTVQAQALIYAKQQALFEEADEQFSQGLAIWLPLLLGIPTALTLITYIMMTRYSASESPSQKRSTVAVIEQEELPVNTILPREVELDVVVHRPG
ncbi:MAG: hypothetical protein ACHP65_05905 [Legionellales bacterium]